MNLAGWQSGYAEDCKSLHVGSIPVPASKFPIGFRPILHASSNLDHKSDFDLPAAVFMQNMTDMFKISLQI